MRLVNTEGKNTTFPKITTILPSGTAGRDENGTYHNALGLESTETHKHVSVIWQRQCIPLGAFAADIHDQAANKKDVRLQADDLRLTDALTLTDGTGFTLSGLKSFPRNKMKQGVIDYLAEDIHSYGNVSDNDATRAKSDLARYLNIELDHVSGERDATLQARMEKKQAQLAEGGLPKSRVKTLQTEIEDLARRIEDSKGFLVRTRHDDDGNNVVRYIASDRYGVIDNTDVMKIIADALPGGWGDSLASHAWNDGDSMLGNVLLPDYIKNRPDSEYGVGFAFKNSEIGRFRFEINPFLFRAICLNGCIWGRSNSIITVDKKHLGNIDIMAIAAEVKNAIAVALAEGEQVLELFDKSKEITVVNQTELVAALSKEYKLTIPQGRAWLNGIAAEPGDTVFHMVQGLTRAAQDFVGDSRRNMEEVAGLIVAPSLTAEIDDIAKLWDKFGLMGERLTEDQVKTYVTAGK